MLERSLDLSSQELLQANSEMRAVFQTIPDLLFRLDHQGTILDFKAGVTNDLVPQPGGLLGKRIQEIPLKDVALQFQNAIDQVRKRKSVFDIEYSLSIQGQESFYEARFVPLLEDQIIVIVRNITERHRAELLRAGQNQILEMIVKGVSLEEVLTSLVRLNESLSEGMLCSILLMDSDERHLRHGAAPSLPEAYNQAINGIAIGPTVGSCGTAAFHKKTVIVTDIVADPLWADFRSLAAHHGLRSCWSAPILSHQGKVLGTFAMYYRQVRSPSPTELRFIESTTRIAGVAIERKHLEEQFREAQKMDAFGQLAGGIAHDFNNILTVILGNVSLLQTCQLSSVERDSVISEISGGANRAANLTRQLLMFGRRQVMQPQRLDLNEVVGDMIKMLRRLIGEDITLEAQFESGAAPVFADVGMMEQVLVNLAINSRDAMPRGGKLSIETSTVTVAQERLVGKTAALPGDYVRLSVRDNGCGIAPEYLTRIFEPFFTTKEVGKGTGLGLATVFSIVEQHHGWIEVDSRENVGTVFDIFLPRTSGIERLVREPQNGLATSNGKETILVVEDERRVRQLIQTALERHGYHVYCADSGVAGIELWQKHRASINLLMTDMVMPNGMGGRELADRLRSEKPDLKVIYCSGYTDDRLGADSPLRDGTSFLEKPFRIWNLLQKIRSCLDRQAASPKGQHRNDKS
jgi:signal transduction histidine kinase/ActR/RegA family two-component response regulator